jgi:hypothetical protein
LTLFTEIHVQDKWRNQQGSSRSRYSTLASLKRDLESISGSSRAAPVSTVPDPLLSSFVGNFSEVDLPKDPKKEPLDETQVRSDNLDQKAAERYAHIQFNSIVFCFLQEII